MTTCVRSCMYQMLWPVPCLYFSLSQAVGKCFIESINAWQVLFIVNYREVCQSRTVLIVGVEAEEESQGRYSMCKHVRLTISAVS